MTPAQKAALVMARSAAAFCDALGLQADNMRAKMDGKRPPFDTSAFRDIVIQRGLTHEQIMELYKAETYPEPEPKKAEPPK